MSKQIEKLIADNREKVVENSPVSYEGEDGIWLYLRNGWQLDGAHCVHEWTVRDLLREFKRVRPCACNECQSA